MSVSLRLTIVGRENTRPHGRTGGIAGPSRFPEEFLILVSWKHVKSLIISSWALCPVSHLKHQHLIRNGFQARHGQCPKYQESVKTQLPS